MSDLAVRRCPPTSPATSAADNDAQAGDERRDTDATDEGLSRLHDAIRALADRVHANDGAVADALSGLSEMSPANVGTSAADADARAQRMIDVWTGAAYDDRPGKIMGSPMPKPTCESADADSSPPHVRDD